MNAMIFTTLKCNLHCSRCYQRCLPVLQDTSKEDFDAFIYRIHKLGIKLNALTFTGGEPSLWPYLKDAILNAIPVTKTIRIVTNGIYATANTFEGAHILDISSYGGINMVDILRLKRTFPGKVKVKKPIHIDYPFPDYHNNDVLPADCGCVGLTLLGEYVYPCAFAALFQTESRIKISQYSLDSWNSFDPRKQEICKRCLVNDKIRRKYGIGLVLECSIWESRFVRLISFNDNLVWWMRSIWRNKNIIKLLKKRWWAKTQMDLDT